MYIEDTAENVLREDLVNLWKSIDWIGGSIKDSGKLLSALKNSSNCYCAWCDKGGVPELRGILSVLSDGYNAYITYLIVDEGYHNLGLGTALFKAFSKDYEGCRVTVLSENAAEFYKKLGFEERMHGLSKGDWVSLDGVSVNPLYYSSKDHHTFSRLDKCKKWNSKLGKIE